MWDWLSAFVVDEEESAWPLHFDDRVVVVIDLFGTCA